MPKEEGGGRYNEAGRIGGRDEQAAWDDEDERGKSMGGKVVG